MKHYKVILVPLRHLDLHMWLKSERSISEIRKIDAVFGLKGLL